MPNSVKNVGEVTVLFLCTSSENILDGIKVIEQTGFSYEKFQRGIIP